MIKGRYGIVPGEGSQEIFVGVLTKSINTVTADTTLTANYHTVVIDATSNTVTVSLPAAPTQGNEYRFKCKDATNVVTVSGNGKNIDTAATIVLILHESLTLQYDGTEWWII